MNILVTGAAGFIGSNLCEALLKEGHKVTGIDNYNDWYSPERKHKNVAPLTKDPNFTMIELDFKDRAKVDELFANNSFDAIAHLGAMGNVRYSVENPYVFIDNNVLGTTNLLEASSRAKLKHFVFASTSSVYGKRDTVPFYESDNTDHPLAPYPASKKACELLGHAYYNMRGLNFTALRFFNVYGPKGRPDMMPYKVMKAMMADKEITLYSGGTLSRDWTFIEDIVQGIILALNKPSGYNIYNLGRGEPVVMTEFIKIAENLLSKKAIIKDVPAPLSEPLITYANVDKAAKELGYSPKTSLPEGMKRFYEWFKAEAI